MRSPAICRASVRGWCWRDVKSLPELADMPCFICMKRHQTSEAQGSDPLWGLITHCYVQLLAALQAALSGWMHVCDAAEHECIAVKLG